MAQRFRLGPWEVDAAGHRLTRRGCGGEEIVRIEPRVTDLLLALAGRAGEVVSREDLLDTVWEGAFVTDEALTTAVYQLRRALGDDARQARFVETVAKGGYRLVAPVEPVTEPAPDRPASPGAEVAPPAAVPPGRPEARGVPWRWAAALACSLLLAALGLARLDPGVGRIVPPDGRAATAPAAPPISVPESGSAGARVVDEAWRLLDRTGPEAVAEALAACAYRRALALDPGAEEPVLGLEKLRSAREEALRGAPRPGPREGLDRLASMASEGPVSPSHLAALYAEIGDESEALAWLERAWRDRDTGLFFLRYDRRWRPYHDHPRVRALLDRLSAS